PAAECGGLCGEARRRGRGPGPLGRQGVEVRFVGGFVTSPRGATHGSPYYKDRLVPIRFLGAGVTPGIDSTRAATVDIVPTLARLIRIPVPDDLDGKALTW